MCLIFFLLVFEAEKKSFIMWGCRGWQGAGPGPGPVGGQDLGFGFREMVGFPAPIG